MATMIRKSFKYRLYPNKEQAVLLNKNFGCVRFVYNWGLEEKIKEYEESGKSLSRYKLQAALPNMKKTEKLWLSEVNAQSLQASLINLDRAFINFFRYKMKFPKFKKKNSRQSFQVPQGGKIDLENGKLIIPKFQEGIRCKISRVFEGETKTFTLSKTTTGKYFISVLVETIDEVPNKAMIDELGTVGIDVGIKNFATLSNGEEIKNPWLLNKEINRLKVLQKRASKKKKGSNNRRKAFHKVAILHEKITNKRSDFLHKLTNRLTTENQCIAIEDLNIAGMLKNHHFAQSISDVSWGEFFRQLEYKCEWRGKTLLKIGRFEPSSRTCDACGKVNNKLKISDREWVCECGIEHDRDFLAARNIKRFALIKDNLKYTGTGCPKELVDVPSLEGRMKQEAS